MHHVCPRLNTHWLYWRCSKVSLPLAHALLNKLIALLSSLNKTQRYNRFYECFTFVDMVYFIL